MLSPRKLGPGATWSNISPISRPTAAGIAPLNFAKTLTATVGTSCYSLGIAYFWRCYRLPWYIFKQHGSHGLISPTSSTVDAKETAPALFRGKHFRFNHCMYDFDAFLATQAYRQLLMLDMLIIARLLFMRVKYIYETSAHCSKRPRRKTQTQARPN